MSNVAEYLCRGEGERYFFSLIRQVEDQRERFRKELERQQPKSQLLFGDRQLRQHAD